MQADGGWRAHAHVGGLAAQSSFVMAPFLPTDPVLQIGRERACIPSLGETRRWEELAETDFAQESLPDYRTYFTQYHRVVESCHPISKLVLARAKDIAIGGDFSPALAYARACTRSRTAYHVLAHSPLTGTWLSSTPELLLAGEGAQWQTQALAGTQLHGTEWTEKNLDEQAYVTRHIREILRASSINYTESPTASVSAGAIKHLSTHFALTMELEQLLPLLARLAPTPAVAGYPCDEAKAFLTAHPDIARHYYTGYLGSFDPAGHSALYVCLRCMQIFTHYCRLYAGGGIMSDSLVDDELAETEQKMRAMEELLVAP